MEKNSASDASTTVQQLRNVMIEFVQERDWSQFHSPKNLSMSIAIEAAELMEHFQWISQEQSRELDDSVKHQVAEELADVLCYCLAMANSMNIDLSTAITDKMVRNREKYPADQFRGLYGLDDPRRNSDG
jgi:NTP pyrophosphatase (non-canonical NTP hydrolase)